MPVTFHTYQHPQDYQRRSAFLVDNYQSGNRDGNWLEPAWAKPWPSRASTAVRL